jgi:hypothetical protein
MRSVVLSLVLALGTLGLSLATPTQVKADEPRGPAYTSDTIPVARYWRGGAYWRGRAFYPGYGYGFYRGYYPYGYRYYAPYRSYYYYPRFYGGGYYPFGWGTGYSPYYHNYYWPGYFW